CGFMAVSTLSGALTIAREAVSDDQLFAPANVNAAAYVEANTPEDAVFLTGTEHLNPVCAIAGRTVVCGPDLWLYWHGFNTRERQEELAAFYEDPEAWTEIPEKYGASYVYVSSYERSSYEVNEAALERIGLKVYENGEAAVYRLLSPEPEP
ncbi:MAG: hypothetical protein IJH79_16370, partial [Lentisphaeria bacterium]|nr:hypothetical protein [Lentisphaeria bacterium]